MANTGREQGKAAAGRTHSFAACEKNHVGDVDQSKLAHTHALLPFDLAYRTPVLGRLCEPAPFPRLEVSGVVAECKGPSGTTRRDPCP